MFEHKYYLFGSCYFQGHSVGGADSLGTQHLTARESSAIQTAAKLD